MKESDFYWATYKNLEVETLALAKQISFTTKQKRVYSMAIADLIIRCAVEIEALSKKLYESLGGDMNPVDSSGEKGICIMIRIAWPYLKKCIRYRKRRLF